MILHSHYRAQQGSPILCAGGLSGAFGRTSSGHMAWIPSPGTVEPAESGSFDRERRQALAESPDVIDTAFAISFVFGLPCRPARIWALAGK